VNEFVEVFNSPGGIPTGMICEDVPHFHRCRCEDIRSTAALGPAIGVA
jgi:hypothetical protein